MSKEKIEELQAAFTWAAKWAATQTNIRKYPREDVAKLSETLMLLNAYFKDLKEERDINIYGLDAVPSKDIIEELKRRSIPAPYNLNDYELAKYKGLDLDSWSDYEKYYGLGEEEDLT